MVIFMRLMEREVRLHGLLQALQKMEEFTRKNGDWIMLR